MFDAASLSFVGVYADFFLAAFLKTNVLFYEADGRMQLDQLNASIYFLVRIFK